MTGGGQHGRQAPARRSPPGQYPGLRPARPGPTRRRGAARRRRPDGRRIAFQVWDWADDGRGYQLHLFLLRKTGAGWRTNHCATDYRALLRQKLANALERAGLADIRWREPEERGYYQPIVTARAQPDGEPVARKG